MSNFIDPDQFVITRKRKKYRFARFSNSHLCFEYDEWTKRAVDCVEIGAGDGMFTVEMAQRYPAKTFVALDVKGDRLQKGAYEAESRGLTNAYFVRARADQIVDLFELNSVDDIWLTFPDPYPKKRSAGRRLMAPYFLDIYKTVLKLTGSLRLKHDNRDFFHWSLEQLVANDWRVEELAFDLHDSSLSDDYKILTSYEKRWLSEGLVTNFVCAKIN